MTDKNDLLVLMDSTVSFDGNGKEFHQCICSVSPPCFGFKGRKAASREIDGQAR
jgi:hypothetical protein